MTDMASASPRPARVPSVSRILAALLEADLTVKVRNGRALALTQLLPLFLLYATYIAKRRAPLLGGPITEVAIALTLGVASLAILGYTSTVARDREKGVFQRLRVTPARGWQIIASRLVVQVLAMLVMAILVLVVATVVLKVTVGAEGWILTCLCVIIGSSVFLSVGQALVGLIQSADTVNAVGRLANLPLFVLGLFAHIPVFGTTFETVSQWSRGGVVIDVFAGSLQPTTWTGETWGALAACLGYAVVFTVIGIDGFDGAPNNRGIGHLYGLCPMQVAQGLSNKQIASKLVLSDRTVESHVWNILNKLGFDSRTQIASWAATRQPLTGAAKG